MSRPRVIEVQHCVSATAVRPLGNRPIHDLFEVKYEYVVAADQEFPRTIARLWLFLRVVSRSAGQTRLRLRVLRRGRQGRWLLVHDYRPSRTLPLPGDRTVVIDQPVQIPHIRLDGPGLFAVAAYFRPPQSRWLRAAVEYFRVRKEA